MLNSTFPPATHAAVLVKPPFKRTHVLNLSFSLTTPPFLCSTQSLMFSPGTDPPRPQFVMYYDQPRQTDDQLSPLPTLILQTDDLPNYCTYSSSGCESSPSSYSALLPEKAVFGGTRHSLLAIPPLVNIHNSHNHNRAYNYQSAVSLTMGSDVHRLVDLIDSCTAKRAFSTGDLQFQHPQYQLSQQRHSVSSSKESSSSSIIEGMLNKASRYSPEEKKERIERYKTKRGHRNFNKKIKYACRKTLADSRPRIRGRFARNNNEDDRVDDKWGGGGHRCYDADDKWENNEDDNWLDLFNAAWLLK